VFIAGLFVLASHELADIADHLQRTADAQRYRAEAVSMDQTVTQHGWDGDWFLRAYDAFGNKIGSRECDEGRIFIESNGMCVMAGLGAEDGRAEQALAAVNEHLATPHGIVLQQPAYSRYYIHMGEISSYPPGYKENAGIFCHTNPWIMIGEAMVGHGDQAHDYYTRISPSQREAISEVHRCEPYVYAQMIAGKDAATHGEAKNSWLSGTAAWNYVAITQWILGVRPTLNGLQIAPVIPASWDGFSAQRTYRGVTYHINVTRSGSGNAVALKVDGQAVGGSLVPLPATGTKDVKVEVTLQ
jgi:cellobiose phosphorylase